LGETIYQEFLCIPHGHTQWLYLEDQGSNYTYSTPQLLYPLKSSLRLHNNLLPPQLLHKLPTRILTTLKKMFPNHSPQRIPQPLLQTKIFKPWCPKNFQELQGLRIANILYIMPEALGNNSNISGGVVECSRSIRAGEDGNASGATDEVRPFVGIGMLVHFAHTAGFDGDVDCGNCF